MVRPLPERGHTTKVAALEIFGGDISIDASLGITSICTLPFVEEISLEIAQSSEGGGSYLDYSVRYVQGRTSSSQRDVQGKRSSPYLPEMQLPRRRLAAGPPVSFLTP